MDTPKRLFGYWIKEIDRLIEAGLGRLLDGEGLTRRDWQVLNTVAAARITTAELDARLAPFLTADEPTVRPHADALAARGWAEVHDDVWSLTGNGRQHHERVAALVQASRKQLMDGISPDEHRTLMDLLQRVATNMTVAA